MFDNIIAKAEELLNRFGEGIVEILRGEKDIAMYSMELKQKMDEIGKEMIKEACRVRLVKNFVFPIYNVSCKVGLCY